MPEVVVEPNPDIKPTSEFGSLMRLAWPLILSNSFTTIQITIDRLFLAQVGADATAAATSAVMLFWTPFILLQCTSSYVATFIAQYSGAGRPERIGPAVWQGLYFSLFAGMLMLSMVPFAENIVSIAQHSASLQMLEVDYFYCLLWMSLPALVCATVTAFFSGIGQTRTVLWINIVGTLVNALLDYCWVLGKFGFPAMGVAGAGWATVVATWASAFTALALLFRRTYRERYGMFQGWHFEPMLFGRLLRFGLPSGAFWMLDMTAFSAFMLLTGWFSDVALAASSVTLTINNLAFIPMMGVGQAVSIRVGQLLGEDNPDRAATSVYAGFRFAAIYMGTISLMYVFAPMVLITPFESPSETIPWPEVAEQTRVLLLFVAFFALADAVNLVFSFGLRGAGDTLFVSMVSLTFAWPVMVVPSYLAWKYGYGLNVAWGFATAYIVVQAICFILRFRGGKWRSMRVIEAAPVVV